MQILTILIYYNIPFLVIVRNNVVIIFFLHAQDFFRLYLWLKFLDHGAGTYFFNYAMHPSFTPKILMVSFFLLLLWLYRVTILEQELANGAHVLQSCCPWFLRVVAQKYLHFQPRDDSCSCALSGWCTTFFVELIDSSGASIFIEICSHRNTRAQLFQISLPLSNILFIPLYVDSSNKQSPCPTILTASWVPSLLIMTTYLVFPFSKHIPTPAPPPRV